MGKNKAESAILNAVSAQNSLTAQAIKKNISTRLRNEIMLSLFNKTFDVSIAATNQQRETAHRLRYRVFCEESIGYEDHTAHMNDMEIDGYDINADHILLTYKPTNTAIGTLRVIRPNAHNWKKSFPLQRICNADALKDKHYISNSCEFSRLCISRTLRKQAQKHLESNKALFTSEKTPFNILEKPFLTHILSLAPIGLMRGAFELTLRNNSVNVLGIMEPYHLKRLQKIGLLINERLGPEIQYHGARQPFRINILDTFENAKEHHRGIWNIVSQKGILHTKSTTIAQANYTVH